MLPAITHDSFKFKSKVTAKRRQTCTSKKTMKKRTPLAIPTPSLLSSSPCTADTTRAATHNALLSSDFDTTQLPQLLTRYVICFDRDTQIQKLIAVAEGFGATVKKEMDKSVTHLIIEPQGDHQKLKVVKQAIQKGIICVSPKWLISCYCEKKNCPAIAYQFEVDSSRKTLDVPHDNDSDSQQHTSGDGAAVPNPFNTEYIDFNALEANKPLEGGQRRLDQYITRTASSNSIPSHSGSSRTRESTVEPVVLNQNDSSTDIPVNSNGSSGNSSRIDFFAGTEESTLSSATNIASPAATAAQESTETKELRARKAAKLAHMEQQKAILAERRKRLEEARKDRGRQEPQRERIWEGVYSQDHLKVYVEKQVHSSNKRAKRR